MNFGEAIQEMKNGQKVARSGWNGKGIFVYLVDGSDVYPADLRGAAQKHVGYAKQSISDKVKINAHIDMKAADDSIIVGWLPSQIDMLSDDWKVIE